MPNYVESPVMLDTTGQEIAERLREIHRALLTPTSGTIYGFRINSSESDPSACVTYLADARNMTPAFMDYTNNKFNWGSWGNAFFLPRPCMVKYDGTVDYYLNPNDYSKKMNGENSDIANDSYEGNAMMEWGQNGKKIWYRIIPDATDNTCANIYIADYQVDSNYRAWSFINNQGYMRDHFYTGIYNGTIDSSGRLRSLSGKAYTALCQGKTAAQEIAAAELNNLNTDKIWFTETYSDIVLINLLLILMGKSLDCQTVFGNGRINQTSAASSMLGTGTMDTKGLFYGSNGNNDGVKIFGMENWWGNQWQRYAGHMLVDYVHKYKMTRTTADGSSADDYNLTGEDYLTGITGPSSNNYVKKMGFSEDGYMTSVVGNGADSAHFWCDYWYQNSGIQYAFFGAYCSDSLHTGPFFVSLNYAASFAYWAIGARASSKPK